MDGEVTYRMVAEGDALPAARYLHDMQHYIPPPDRTVFWVAEKDGKVVGAVALTNTPVVESFCSDSAGVAQGLFNAAHEWVTAAKIPLVYMHTSNRGMEALLLRARAVPMAEEFFVLRPAQEAA